MEMSSIEIAALITGLAYVMLMIQVNRWAWVAGNISVALQAWLFFSVRLYADTMLQGVYFIMGVIGWLQWRREDAENTTASDTQTVRRITWDTVPALLLGVSSGAIVLGYLLARYTNAALPYIDSSLAAMSIAATGLQIRKFIENWLMWIVIDVAYVVVYSVRGLEITAALYFIFTVLAALGWREWRTYSAVES